MTTHLHIVCSLLLASAASLAWGAGSKEAEPPALRGDIKHRAVAEFPLPRDRTRFGIGEEVEYWLEPRDADGPDAVIAWLVDDGSVYPVIGAATIVTLGMEAGSFTVSARRRDRPVAGKQAKPAPAPELQKWIREQLAGFPKGQRDPLKDGAPAPRAYPKELQPELYRLDGMRKGPNTAFDEVDAMGKKLLDKYAGAMERGQIYYMLAHVHAQSGLRTPERVIEYAQKALAQPLEPLQVPRMYVYWGDAVRVARGNEPVAARRKWAAIVYLAGLRELLEYPLPSKPPPLPLMVLGRGRGRDPAALEQHAKQLEERQRAEFIGSMIFHRKVLTGQLTDMYARLSKGADYDELRELAAGVFREPRHVEALLRAVKGAAWPE